MREYVNDLRLFKKFRLNKLSLNIFTTKSQSVLPMRWTLKPQPEQEKTDLLQKELGVSKTIATLLVQRGIETFEEAKTFFRPDLKNLHDPFLMKGMQTAVERVEEALAKGQKIMVYGDYDVDGTTSVALMASYLKQRGANFITYIPDRYKEGYGVSLDGIDVAKKDNCDLIICLDCGIKAVEKVAYAKEKNIDFIICDHHRPGEKTPEAVAVLDPQQEDCKYPFKGLCGCGVGFKLIQGIEQKHGNPAETLVPFLDLVATAIGADIVPITDENRILAHFGMKQINTKPRKGFQAILERVKKDQLTITDVVFIIAPRINAAGRMKHGLHAVDLLLEDNIDQARNFAREIETYNSDRKTTDRGITQEALNQIEKADEKNRKTTVVFQENWHKGVIGIVASRLTETYYRPTLVFTQANGKMAASARSVKGFDVYNALEACSDHIEQFGGHKYAAGLTLDVSEYENFKQKFEEVVTAQIEPHLLQPELAIDSELNFRDITNKFWRILKQFGPFGPGNMTPVFLSKNLSDTGYAKPVGEKDKHLKCSFRQNLDKRLFKAIGFGLGDKYALVEDQKKIQAAYSIDENEWNNKVSWQLKIRDLREDVNGIN